MMETVDSALISFAQCFMRDISAEKTLSKRKIILISIITYTFVISFALLHKVYGNASIQAVMAGAYSAMVVLAVPAVLRITGYTLPDSVVVFSILLGFASTWLCTFGPVEDLNTNIKIVLPMYAGPVASFVPIAIATIYKKIKG